MRIQECLLLEQRFDLLCDFFGVGVDIEHMRRLQEKQLLAFHETLLSASGYVQHDVFLGSDPSVADGLDQRGQRYGRSRVDVDAFQFGEQLFGRAGFVVRRDEYVSARVEQRVEQPPLIP